MGQLQYYDLSLIQASGSFFYVYIEIPNIKNVEGPTPQAPNPINWKPPTPQTQYETPTPKPQTTINVQK